MLLGISLLVLLIASLIGAGVLFRHQRVLTYLAAGVALAQVHWLLLTLVARTVLAGYGDLVFLGGSVTLLLLWGGLYRWWQPIAAWRAGGLLRDGWVAMLSLLVLGGSSIIVFANGWQQGEWVTHGFYNGDTVTFAALVNRSLGSVGLLNSNPFANGGELEYPTLLHAGVAELLGGATSGFDWFHWLPGMVLFQILITIPLFFLLWDVGLAPPAARWHAWLGVPNRAIIWAGQAGVVLYVIALSWDNFVYPQSHFFLTALFLLLAAVLTQAYGQRGIRQWISVIVGSGLSLVLLLSNAVTGTAAVAVLVVWLGLRVIDKKRAIAERALCLGLTGIWLALFLAWMPGEGSLGGFGFSYSAAIDMLRLSPIVLALLIAAWRGVDRSPYLAAVMVGLSALAVLTFMTSTRDIVVANASRFFYHAVLVSFPLLAEPLVRIGYWIRRELWFTTHSLGGLTTGWIAFAVFLFVVALPAGASVASAYDNLLFKDEQRLRTSELEALQWVVATEPAATFIADMDPPFSIPLFTGRAVVRTDYWLSPQDDLAASIEAAFRGEEAAQVVVAAESGAHYLWLSETQALEWPAVPEQQVFTNDAVSIYYLGDS